MRVSSRKPPGGELGHHGDTLRLQETADRTIIHRVSDNPATPLVCSCGSVLAMLSIPARLSGECRQVFDIPAPRLEVSEHRVETHACSCCGHEYHGAFPPAVQAPVQFGERFTAMAALLNVQHCLPVFRCIRSYCSTVAKHGLSRIDQFVNALARMLFLPRTT